MIGPRANGFRLALKMMGETGEDVPKLAGPPKPLKAPPAFVSAETGAQQVPTKSAKDIFTEWDRDSNGRIDLEEFKEAMKNLRQQEISR